MDTGEAITLMVDVARGEEAVIGFDLARRVRRVYAMVGLVRADIAAFTPTFVADPASWARLDKHEVEAVAAHEVSMVFGVSPLSGAAMVDQAVHLVEVLPRTLAALAAGTLDMARVRHLVAATSTTDLSEQAARVVEDAALAGAGAGPWEGPTIQVFKARVRRAVLRVQSATAQEEAAQVAQRTGIMVELDQDHAGLAILKVCGPTQDIMWLSRTLYDLGDARPSVDPDGNRVSTGRRRSAPCSTSSNAPSWATTARARAKVAAPQKALRRTRQVLRRRGPPGRSRGVRVSWGWCWCWCCTRTPSSGTDPPRVTPVRSAASGYPSRSAPAPPGPKPSAPSSQGHRRACCWPGPTAPCNASYGSGRHRPRAGPPAP